MDNPLFEGRGIRECTEMEEDAESAVFCVMNEFKETFEEEYLRLLNTKFHKKDAHRSVCMEFGDLMLEELMPIAKKVLEEPEKWRPSETKTHEVEMSMQLEEMMMRPSNTVEGGVEEERGVEVVERESLCIRRNRVTQQLEVYYPTGDEATNSAQEEGTNVDISELSVEELTVAMRQCLTYEDTLRGKLIAFWQKVPELEKLAICEKVRQRKEENDAENEARNIAETEDTDEVTMGVRNAIRTMLSPVEELRSLEELLHGTIDNQTTKVMGKMKVSGTDTNVENSMYGIELGGNPSHTVAEWVLSNGGDSIGKGDVVTSASLQGLKQATSTENRKAARMMHPRRVLTLADIFGDLSRLKDIQSNETMQSIVEEGFEKEGEGKAFKGEKEGEGVQAMETFASNHHAKGDAAHCESVLDEVDGIVGMRTLKEINIEVLDELNAVSNQASFFAQLAREIYGTSFEIE